MLSQFHQAFWPWDGILSFFFLSSNVFSMTQVYKCISMCISASTWAIELLPLCWTAYSPNLRFQVLVGKKFKCGNHFCFRRNVSILIKNTRTNRVHLSHVGASIRHIISDGVKSFAYQNNNQILMNWKEFIAYFIFHYSNPFKIVNCKSNIFFFEWHSFRKTINSNYKTLPAIVYWIVSPCLQATVDRHDTHTNLDFYFVYNTLVHLLGKFIFIHRT